MRTAGIALTLFAALLFAPSAVQRIVQRIRHRRDLQAELRRVTSERDEALGNVDYWKSQYHGGVDAIIDRLRVAAADETPTRDRLVLEAMERQFENGGGS